MTQWYFDVLNIISRCFHAVSLLLVIFLTFAPRKNLVHKNWFFLFSAIIIGIVDRFLFENSHSFVLYFFSFFMLFLFYTAIFFDGLLFLKGVMCLILLLYKTFLVPIGDMAAIKILHEGMQPLSGFPHVLSQMIIALAMFPLAGFLIKYKIVPPRRISPAWVRLVTLLMGIITLNLMFLVQTIPDSVSNVNYNLCMILIVSICYYLIYNLMQSFYKEIEYSIEIEQLKFEKKYEEELQEIYRSLKKLRHDFKNHILCIGLMLKQQEYKELECYCEELSENIYSLKQHIDTGNLIANVVLNQKYLHALSRNIPVDIHASLPENMSVKKMDLCALLSNLFDNALEASEHIDDPWIRIEIKPVKNYIYLLFENKSHRISTPVPGSFETTKDNKLEHGFGLDIVKEITKRYDGIIDITAGEDYFKIKIMIPQ